MSKQEWTTLCASGIEEIVPTSIRFEQRGLLFSAPAKANGRVDVGLLSRVLLQNVVELYLNDRMMFAAPAYKLPAWGVGFLPPGEAPAADPRKLLVPIDCVRGDKLLYQLVRCVGLGEDGTAKKLLTLVLAGSHNVQNR